jgi:hypothetical protein
MRATTIALAALLLAQAAPLQALSLEFAGREWQVRDGTGGPGPNRFDSRNVRIDADGKLHLRIVYRQGRWTTAELYLPESLGFGTYEFRLQGRPDRFDANVVLGLFNYPPAAVGPDGSNEIDIEFARWGEPGAPAGNWTVYPAIGGLPYRTQPFEVTLDGPRSSYRFVWRSCSVDFAAWRGHGAKPTSATRIASWRYAPAQYLRRIPQQALPVHLNFWLFRGHAPTDGRDAEIVVTDFRFTPLPATDTRCPAVPPGS